MSELGILRPLMIHLCTRFAVTDLLMGPLNSGVDPLSPDTGSLGPRMDPLLP